MRTNCLKLSEQQMQQSVKIAYGNCKEYGNMLSYVWNYSDMFIGNNYCTIVDLHNIFLYNVNEYIFRVCKFSLFTRVVQLLVRESKYCARYLSLRVH